ncbi:hypothetical protein [Pseudoalteromonas rubra]|uniref:Uncharacterized protein n=1 Tax=Pseudoalteromonas rubra TaxID=43658 RepID=A0A0U3IED1_9GAMM|nr:hypothetical protein [Pseudoalteromonas rubra]ALU46144.1 hypothetical protein AT705_24590 [Pseudoalteromonas rubra]
MMDKSQQIPELINAYYTKNVELILILKRLADFEMNLESIYKIDAELSTLLKSTSETDMLTLYEADSRIPLFVPEVSAADLQVALRALAAKKAKVGCLDHIFRG